MSSTAMTTGKSIPMSRALTAAEKTHFQKLEACVDNHVGTLFFREFTLEGRGRARPKLVPLDLLSRSDERAVRTPESRLSPRMKSSADAM